MAKLFVTDLDGTLLNSSHQISDKNLEALQMLKEADYDIAFCSGRVLKSVRNLGKKSKIKPYYIANNGAIIATDKKVIFDSPLAYDKLKMIIDLALDKGYGFHMYDRDTYYSNIFEEDKLEHLRLEGSDEYQVNVVCREDVLDYILENHIPIYKIMLHMKFSNDKELTDFLTKSGGLYLAMSGVDSSDIMCEGVSKANAVNLLISYLDKEYEKIVCIGDHENDIPMIKSADIGIAMDNAIEELKETSDWVTKSNDQDGFYHAVKYVLEKEKN